jgi:hypothetical protein
VRCNRRDIIVVATAMLGSAVFGTCAVLAAEEDAADLQALSSALEKMPDDLLTGNELRRLCRQRKIPGRCADVFERLVKRHPNVPALRFNAALAYVDDLPGHSLLIQAKLSTNSMGHASAVLDHEPQNWLALYIRGLNNLYWPTWYRRTDNAIADLTRCIEISEAGPSSLKGTHAALAYIALGDAYVKQNKLDTAREIWTRGASLHGVDELEQRLAIEPARLADTIEQIRSREVPVDTDLSSFMPLASLLR